MEKYCNPNVKKVNAEIRWEGPLAAGMVLSHTRQKRADMGHRAFVDSWTT
jgi:hypothetical protein